MAPALGVLSVGFFVVLVVRFTSPSGLLRKGSLADIKKVRDEKGDTRRSPAASGPGCFDENILCGVRYECIGDY